MSSNTVSDEGFYYCKTMTLRKAIESIYPSFKPKIQAKEITISETSAVGEFTSKYLSFEDRYLVNLRIFNKPNRSIILCLLADLLIYQASPHEVSIKNDDSELSVSVYIDESDELERILDTCVILPYNFD